MALTKARKPVTAINEMVNGTSNIDIPTLGGDIDINVAGVDALDISSTDVTSSLPVTSSVINGETLNLLTALGSTLLLRSGVTENALLGTTAHPTVLGANSLNNLILNTDGTTTVMNTGTLGTHIVDKNYVDTQVAAIGSGSGTVAINGEVDLALSGGGILGIKWGRFNSLIPNTLSTITYVTEGLTAFPTNTLMVQVTNINTALGTQEASTVVSGTPAAASFQVFHPGGAGSLNPGMFWFALGN
jgi:hypothetical protein